MQSTPQVPEKRHNSSRTTEVDDEARARKIERIEPEQDRWASLVDKEVGRRRVQEIAARALSFVLVRREKSTTDGAEVDVVTIDGGAIVNPMGSEKWDPSVC